MSGHSKWATTKHKKAAIDAKRGKLFARLIKNIEVAARTGGGDPTGNPTLFDAIQKAKKNSVPADNITRAVKRGSGEEAGGADWQTIMYEGYGPGGVAFLVECLTDNRNRAASDVRVAFSRNGGNLADPGSVAFQFDHKGVIRVEATGDEALMTILDAGAEDATDDGKEITAITDMRDLHQVRQAIVDAGLTVADAGLEYVGKTQVEVSDPDKAARAMRLLNALDDLDDVTGVHTNADITAEV